MGRRTFAATGTILLHATLLAIALFRVEQPIGSRLQTPRDPEASALVSIVSRPIPALIIPKDGHGQLSMRCPRGTMLIYESGLIYDADTGIIISAPTYMPAYRAGIRVGDVLVTRGVVPDHKGWMDIGVLQGDDTEVWFHVRAAEICYRNDGS